MPQAYPCCNHCIMKVKINNREIECQAENLSQLITELNLPDKGMAVAVGKRMVPRAEWTERILNEGDDILIIKAVCGG